MRLRSVGRVVVEAEVSWKSCGWKRLRSIRRVVD